MEVERVEAVVAGGESLTVEFKGESRAPLNDRALVEAAVCLANGHGGVLLVGVEDDGSVTGARPRHDSLTVPERVQALIANRTIPPVAADVDVVEVRGRPVLVVEVDRAARVVGTSAGLYVRRALRLDGSPQCIPFPAHEMLARAGADADAQLTGLSDTEIARAIGVVTLGNGSPQPTMGHPGASLPRGRGDACPLPGSQHRA